MPAVSAEFLDTNILLYEWDAGDPDKRTKARRLISRLGPRATISSQVAQEFAMNARSKFGMSVGEADRILESYSAFRFVPVSMRLVRDAVSTAESAQIAFWDALIVEAAREGGCAVLHTEDLNASLQDAGPARFRTRP